MRRTRIRPLWVPAQSLFPTPFGRYMDVLDAAILRSLGIEPFAGYADRPRGLRASDVARALGRNVRLVQDRITRMERSGVITGYAMVPNPRHLGLQVTTLYVPTAGAADAAMLAAFSELDGFIQTIAYLGEGVCLSLGHHNPAELERRVATVRRLAGEAGPPRAMYGDGLSSPQRAPTPLDWRIIAAFAENARRTMQGAAEEVGVTVKTLRLHLARLRAEGSIDEVAKLDFAKMDGIIPFELAVWCDDPDSVAGLLVGRLREHYWGHFRGPPDGFSDILLRVFATTPAEVNRLVKVAGEVPGVRAARALLAAGQFDNHGWIKEAIARQVQATK